MPDEITPEDEEFFATLLSKKGESWLTTKLQELGLTKAPTLEPGVPQPKPDLNPVAGFAEFLQAQLAEKGTENKSLRDRLESVMDVLTPEQRTLLRSPPKEGDPLLPKPKNPSEPPVEPKPKPKTSFLKRL